MEYKYFGIGTNYAKMFGPCINLRHFNKRKQRPLDRNAWEDNVKIVRETGSLELT